MIKKIIVKISKGAAEIFQSLDIKFALVAETNKDTYTQQHLAIKCRDFLGDCLWSKKKKLRAQIYGFSYDFLEAPFDANALKLTLKFPNDISMKNFKDNISYLHNKEEQAGTKLSEVFPTDQENTLLVISDKIWQSSVWKISLITFYMKIASYKNTSLLEEPEDSYFEILSPKAEKTLLSKVLKKDNKWHKEISYVHNYSGFVSLIKSKENLLHETFFGEKANAV